MKRKSVKVSIPSQSPALQSHLQNVLETKYSSVDFTFVSGDVDSRCRVVETTNGPALWAEIQRAVARLERDFLASGGGTFGNT
jgi:hypothetical protein